MVCRAWLFLIGVKLINLVACIVLFELSFQIFWVLFKFQPFLCDTVVSTLHESFPRSGEKCNLRKSFSAEARTIYGVVQVRAVWNLISGIIIHETLKAIEISYGSSHLWVSHLFLSPYKNRKIFYDSGIAIEVLPRISNCSPCSSESSIKSNNHWNKYARHNNNFRDFRSVRVSEVAEIVSRFFRLKW